MTSASASCRDISGATSCWSSRPSSVTWENLCADYSGGYWEFFDLSNGGCYLAPSFGSFSLTSPNGFEATVSADVAGLIAALYAFSTLSFEFRSAEVFADRYHQLREFALEHASARDILAAID